MKEHNDLVLELPGFVPEDLCKQIIDEFENAPDSEKGDGEVLYGGKIFVDKELKNSIDASIGSLADKNFGNCKAIQEKIIKYLRHAVTLYTKCLIDEYPGRKHPEKIQKMHTFEPMIEGMRTNGVGMFGLDGMQRQPKDALYKWHYDSQEPRSYLFGILYLNTLEPEEGGHTTFLSGRSIRPEAGKVMLSPGSWTYAHAATKVNTEYKYILPFHIYHGKYPGDDKKYYWWDLSNVDGLFSQF